ncbi:MAG TPA: S41 family peptidase [Steroidobacteraceae bacterium]|jgi:C-terminal processing protease CtpA/Prc
MLLALTACGGGGSSEGGPGSLLGNSGLGGGGGGNYVAGTFMPSSTFEAKCAAPRTGQDPNNGNQPFPDTQGSVTSENNWLRSWTNETYLWYSEVPDLNPASYATPAYFDLLKTSAKTASGNDKDKFHFTEDTAVWEQMSQSGVTAGYGAQWFLIEAAPPRQIVVAYVDPGSPAATAGLARGDSVLTIDGVDAVNGGTSANVDALNAGLFPENLNETHKFNVRHIDGTTANVSLQSANVTSTPVQNVTTIPTAAGPVGYILFNDHIATAESEFVDAINNLKAQNVTDLVLDIRYNGGGYLDLASEVAFMIAGPTRTAGQTFERIAFNDKNPTTDPVTGEALTPTPFHSTTQGFSTIPDLPLPTLNLNRVFVLTGSGTCSASESIINSLQGVGVQVILIGATTCGKPYGFYPTDNCGTTYFSIQFKGVNAQGFGEYTDGFSPRNTVVDAGELVDGCSVNDDFTHGLGDAQEARLAAALNYRSSAGTCPTAPTGTVGLAKQQQSAGASEGYLPKSPWRENRILRRLH